MDAERGDQFTSEGGRAGPVLPATSVEAWPKKRNVLESREQIRATCAADVVSDMGDGHIDAHLNIMPTMTKAVLTEPESAAMRPTSRARQLVASITSTETQHKVPEHDDVALHPSEEQVYM